jgi:hypothetical protein
VALLLLSLSGCTTTKDAALPPASVSEVLERHNGHLLSIPGVVGTAEGSCGGRPCILVLVARLTPQLQQKIPSVLEGIPVEARETGKIEAR